MTPKEANKFKKFVDRKLSAERVSTDDTDNATKVLNKCVMGKKLVKAFLLIYSSQDK